MSAGVDGGHPIRFRSGRVPLVTGCFGTMAVALLLLAIAPITASQGGRRPVLLILGIAMIAYAAAGLVVSVLLTRPMTLTPEFIRIPRGFRSCIISISDVAGVGLVFKRHMRAKHPGGWYLRVWRIDGTNERTGISYQPLRYPTKLGAYGRDRNVKPWAFDAVASTDFDRLDSTGAAQVARDVHRAILAKQGSCGPLATRQLQKHVLGNPRRERFPTAAFWSPDGEVGYAQRCSPRPDHTSS